jgi:membrane-bound lytic murein transglycosylase B
MRLSVLMLSLVALTNLSLPNAQDPVSPAPPAPIAADTKPSFAEWVAGVRAEALTRGIRPEIVDDALSGLTEPLDVVIERDRAQPEVVLPLETYITRNLAARVKTGREVYATNRALLDRVSKTYDIPSRIIISIWGAESNFGRFSGVRPTIEALATLAWDPRRSTLFRAELFNALEILNRGDIELPKMKGSWAGAMGQPQFMPSSYLEYAQDFDHDGRRDIWDSKPDVFASIANYLKGYGWVAGQRWGREVRIPQAVMPKVADVARSTDAGRCQATRDMTVRLPLSAWRAMGVLGADGKALPSGDLPAALVSGNTRHFLVYGNYDALLGYNCAHAYALSVALVADQIG